MAVSTLGGLRVQPQAIAARRSGFATEVAADLASAETAWRGLEAEGAAPPYQRFDWVAPFAAATGLGSSVKAVIVRDAAGAVAALLPLVVSRKAGLLRIGSVVGGKHANLFEPLLRPGLAASLAPDRAAALLRDVAAALRLDALHLREMPTQLGDAPNPFAAAGRPSPSPIYRLVLDGDGDAVLKRGMSADARKKLRSKERQLGALGRLELRQAGTEHEIALMLEAFFRQKAGRFRELGIPDPFAEPGIPDFLRRACMAGLEAGRPAIELYGLMLDDRPLAIFGGAASPDRLSGMFISFEQGDLSRYSPGDLLVTQVVRAQCERGRRLFDLGVGEARYKRGICDGTEQVVNLSLAFTPRGRAFLAAAAAADGLRGRIKGSERAMKLVAALRRIRARF